MASAPPQPPESIILGQFTGIKNTVSAERLQTGELEAGVNIDIDDAGQVRRRRGYALRDGASWHSVTTLDDTTYGVRDGVLGIVRPNFTHEPLVDVGPHPLAYVNIGADVYFASVNQSGKIIDGQAQPWGQLVSEGQWISPVMRPTETLGAISGRLLGKPPIASDLAHYKGRIYLAHEKLLWATELYLYDLVDKTKNYLQFEHDITMVRAVSKGIYVGTTQSLFFLSGTFANGLKCDKVTDAGVIPGSAVWAPTADVHPQAKSGPVPEGTIPMFMTTEGICVGLEDGQVYNLTRGKVVFPEAVSAAALYRADQGANAYVAVTDSDGGPTAGVRIGDYVEAEIIRASQGG
jgi:hypothetical protein